MAKSLFDHLNDVYTTKSAAHYDNLSDADKKSYNVYMLNRFMSMNVDYLPVVNAVQQYWDQIGAREHFLFFQGILPRKKTFSKYIKKSKEVKYEPWLVALLSKAYQVSTAHVNRYLDVFYSSKDGIQELKIMCEGYGIDNKQLKKAKLV